MSYITLRHLPKADLSSHDKCSLEKIIKSLTRRAFDEGLTLHVEEIASPSIVPGDEYATENILCRVTINGVAV